MPPALVQSNQNQGGSSLTFAGAQTAGNAIVAVATWEDTTAFSAAFTDTKGNTYVQKYFPQQTFGFSSGSIQVWVATNIAAATAGSNSVSFSGGFPNGFEVFVAEISGVDTTAPFDAGSEAAASGTSASSASVTSGSLASSSEILLAICLAYGGVTSATAPFTLIGSVSPFGTGYAKDVVSASTSVTATMSLNSGTDWMMAVFGLKASGGASVTPEEYAPPTLSPGPSSPTPAGFAEEEFARQPVRALEELQPWAPALPLVLGAPAPSTDEELPQPPPPPGALEEYVPAVPLFTLPAWAGVTIDEELPQAVLAGEEWAPPLLPAFAPVPPVLFAFDEEMAWQQVFEDYLPPLVFPAIVWAQSAPFYEEEFLRAPTTIAIEEYAPGQASALPVVGAPPYTVFLLDEEFVQFVPPIVGSVVVDAIGVGHYIGLGHV